MGDTHKLLLPFDGRPLVRHSVEAALAAGVGRVAVITGRDAEHIAAVLDDLPVDPIENPDFADGLATSVTRAIEWAEPIASGLLILLADEPGVDPGVVRRAVEIWRSHPSEAVRVRYADRLGHPVVIPLESTIGRPSGDSGMRELLAGATEVPVDSPAPIDVDTEADYRQALARLRQ